MPPTDKRMVRQDAVIFAAIVAVMAMPPVHNWLEGIEANHHAVVAAIVGGVHLLTRLLAASGLTGGDTSPVIGTDRDADADA